MSPAPTAVDPAMTGPAPIWRAMWAEHGADLHLAALNAAEAAAATATAMGAWA